MIFSLDQCLSSLFLNEFTESALTTTCGKLFQGLSVLIEKLKKMRQTYEEKCSQFWRKEIDASQGDSRRLWRALNGVMGATSGVETGPLSADDFAKFFSGQGERCP